MKRWMTLLVMAAMTVSWGCGGPAPPPKVEMTDQLSKEIDEHNQQVQDAELREAQRAQQAGEQ